MIHDPCIVPQLRSKKRERDDWFLVRMGCFNSDTEKGDPRGFDDDEAADAADRAAATIEEGDPRGFEDDEFADELESRRASTGVGGSSIGDSQTRAVNIATVAGIPDIDFDEESDRDESPLSFFEDVTAKQARERREKERGIRQAIREEEFSNMLDALPGVDPDEPEGGAAPGVGTFRSDIFGDPDPFDLVPDDLPGGAAQLTSIPGVRTAGSPLQQQIKAARGQAQTPAAAMEQEVRQNLGGSAGDFEGLTAQQLGAAPSLGPTAMTGDVSIDAADIPEAVPDPSSGLPRSIRSRGVTYGDEDFLPGGVVDQRLEGIAAARAAAAKSPLAQSPDLSGVRIGDVNIPLGPAGMLAQGIGAVGTEIYNTFANPTAKALANLEDPNRYGAVYGTDGSLLGSVNRETGAVQPTEGNAFNPELEPYYAEARRRQEEDREARGGTGNQAPVAAVQPTMTAAPAPVPQASPMTVPAYQYQPRSPVQYSYTGIPTLAPVMLKPTFTAPERFSPLFNLGRTRRS